MQEIAKSDLFFMITALVVVLVGALLIVLVAYALKIAHDISRISSLVRDESELIKEDIDDARREFKAKGLKGLGWFSIIKAAFRRVAHGRNTKKK